MKDLTTREFSKATGIAQGTLRRWAAEGVLIPAHANGKGKPALYSEAQLQADAVLNFKPRALTVQDETASLSLSDRVNRIRKLTGDTARNLIEIGKHLTIAKAELPHGDFSAWVQDNFGWTIRTAQNLMAVAERFGDMDIANFKPSHLQALLALPSGDEQKFIAEQAAAGQPVETQSARQLKENIKQHNRQKSKGTKAKTFSHLEPTNPAITPTSNALSDLEHVDEAPAVIDVNALTIQAEDSATDSPADETADAPIDSELENILALISAITDADKLRRIQAHIKARLAKIDRD